MKIAIVGKGRVGGALGPAFATAGHDVVYGVRDPADDKYDSGDGIALRTPAEAARGGDVVILSVPWGNAETALGALGSLAGKIVVDCNNPVDFDENGPKFVGDDRGSLGERLAGATDAALVKALNQVGSPVMAAAHDFAEPLQFVAGDDREACRTVEGLLADIGFAPRYCGGIDMARHLESMAYLWITQAFRFGMDPETAWFLPEADDA